MDLYLKFNDPEYAAMVKELLDDLAKGLLEEVLNLKGEFGEIGDIIGRVIGPNDPLTDEEAKKLQEVGFDKTLDDDDEEETE